MPNTTSNIPEAETLDDHIQSLPQELQDMILNHTLAPQVNTTINITTSYNPPLGLQINRTHHQKTAEAYYSTNTFELRYEKGHRVRTTWLIALPVAHRRVLTRVCIEVPCYRARRLEQFMAKLQKRLRPELENCDLKFRYMEGGDKILPRGVMSWEMNVRDTRVLTIR